MRRAVLPGRLRRLGLCVKKKGTAALCLPIAAVLVGCSPGVTSTAGGSTVGAGVIVASAVGTSTIAASTGDTGKGRAASSVPAGVRPSAINSRAPTIPSSGGSLKDVTSAPPRESAQPATELSPSSRSAPPPTATTSPSQTAEPTAFGSSVSVIGPELATRMRTSWRPGCPVGLEGLRYLTISYWGFDGADHDGELVVAATVADDVVAIFRDLYEMRYPIASLRLVDDFGGDDGASMAANNSSAFNCRPVTGGGGFSEHSYGSAIDLNPQQNPFVSGDLVLPDGGRDHLDRSPGPGVLIAGDPAVRAFEGRGWSWGGRWTEPIDYQHFSISGG